MERQRVGLNVAKRVRRQRAPLREQIRDPLRSKRLVILEREKVRIVRRHRAMVGGDDEMGRRVVGVGQCIERNPAVPLHLTGPALGGHRSDAAGPDRDAARRVVTDVSLDVGVDEVLRRDDEVLERCGELGPVLRRVEPQKCRDSLVLVVERGPAERERFEHRRPGIAGGFGVVRVDRVGHQRAVPGDPDGDIDGRLAAHVDRLGDEAHRLERAPELGALARWIEVLAIQILDVGEHVGLAPRDVSIAADRHRRRAWQRGADDVEVARRHVRQIPERGHVRGEVRIVGEQGLAARGERAVDDPVVRPEALGGAAAAEQIADEYVAGREACGEAGGPARRPAVGRVLGSRRLRARFLGRSAAAENAQCVRRIWREQVVHPCQPDARGEVVSHELHRVVRAQIPRHHLGPDQHVGARPRFGFEAQDRELGRECAAVVRFEKRVHSGHVGVYGFARIGRQAVPRRACRAAEAHGTEKSILRDRRRPENLGQAAKPDPPLELHLPQPVLGVHVAEPVERVSPRRGKNMRDGVGVADDLDRSADPGDADRPVHHRKRSARVSIRSEAQR